MGVRHARHFTLEEANAQIPWVVDKLAALRDARARLTDQQARQALTEGAPTNGGGWYVSRLTISCCAADALTYKVQVSGIAAPPTDAWVEVTGVWQPGGQVKRDDAIPVMKARQVKRIAQPHNPYE